MKRKIGLMSLVPVALLTITGAAHADGTGVGNGTNSARDQYLESLRREMAPASVNGGRSVSPESSVTAWCSRISSILRRERQRAMLQVQYNRNAEALRILEDALIMAGRSLAVDPDFGGPMTKKLIDRALMYSQALSQVPPQGAGIPITTKLNLLFESVEFIVKVAREMDPPYYIPYRYRYGRCHECGPDFNYGEFEREFVRLAARQLRFVTNHLTETHASGRGVQTFPLGDPRGFLTVAELATSFVAQDLSENLHAYANACSIQELESLSGALNAYNLYGDRGAFPNDRWAVAQAAEEMSRIAHDIEENAGCRDYR